MKVTAAVLSIATAKAKVSVDVLRSLEVSDTTDVLIGFVGPNLDSVQEAAPQDRRQAVFDRLTAHSVKMKTESATVLDSGNCKHYWIASAAVCRGLTKAQVEEVSRLPAVKTIQTPDDVHLISPIVKEGSSIQGDVNSTVPQWGISTIGAPAIWKYFKGKGVVVGSIDTGAEYRHEAIKNNWRSNKGWFNPYNGTAIEFPVDSAQHGTHTIGTMVGGNGIGVAPEAQWISCMGLYINSGSSEALMECGQFMLCPTRLDGTHPECKLGADVINNSWGSNRGYNPVYEGMISSWRAAGITPVFSNGNSGPACATTGNPGMYSRVISVGAIGSYENDPTQLAFFSSKGVVHYTDYQNKTVTLVKPDISAPGFYTRSADALKLDGYLEMAGTSMAAPHIAGVVALLKSAQSDLTYDEIYNYLTKTADRDEVLKPEPEFWYFKNGTVRAPGAPNCNGTSDASWPNNRYGFGRVNVGTILRDGKLNDTPTKVPTTVAPTPQPTSAPTTTPCPTSITPKPTSAPTTTPCPTSITPKPTTTMATPAPTTVKPSVCEKAVDGIDYFGNDIKSTQRQNHEDCCDDCSKTLGCVAYVWTPWNDGTCFLKWKAGATAPYWGAKAAKVKNPVGSCEKPQPNTDYYGNDIARIPADAEDCCSLCLTNDNCAGYSHYHGICYLKSKLSSATAKDGVTSGVRVR
ncbi:hypothetical protein H310_09512 [Aphanomyces invadans]|uniref:subtilisin n=1 Tax=Aphanomyces invadans TaxID=157072 RepID=A0A024TVG3_9STRA|nr:hypothetical protein H310_09512 [Aphanomyces invadans]ETV97616.1 hypothetical protein H310_09512 [Aphanomyces invadans]|eukprot:XP_008873825.1 hypothetical protein H310_09512 [Aphanomyces invadans]